MHIQRNLGITHVAAIFFASMIYFEIYHHNWFLELFFGTNERNKQNAIYIALLFCISVMYTVLLLKNGRVLKVWNDSTKRLFIPVLLYFIFGFFTVVLHEQGFDAVKRYLFYLFTPMMVFLSILAIYRNNKDIIITLHVLFFLGVVFSVYSIVLHTAADIDVIAVYSLPSHLSADREYLARFTVPGLGPNVLPSMLVPLILTGFYFIRNISGKSKYLYMGLTSLIFYNIVITASRGALVSLTAGMLYLAYKKWFKFNKVTLFIVLSFFLVLFIGGDLLFSRIDVTKAVLERALAEGVTDAVGKSENRLVALIDTSSSYIMHNPILGSGFTYFTVSQAVGEHNLYTTLLAQGGLAVFIPFVLILFYLYVNSNKLLKRDVLPPTSKDIGILLNAGLIAYIIDLNFPPGFFHYYWIWFGFVAAWTRNCEMEYQVESKLP